MIIPAAMVGVRLVDFLVATVVLIAMMLYYGVAFGRSILMLPLLILLTTCSPSRSAPGSQRYMSNTVIWGLCCRC
jgi:hypothetical protein